MKSSTTKITLSAVHSNLLLLFNVIQDCDSGFRVGTISHGLSQDGVQLKQHLMSSENISKDAIIPIYQMGLSKNNSPFRDSSFISKL